MKLLARSIGYIGATTNLVLVALLYHKLHLQEQGPLWASATPAFAFSLPALIALMACWRFSSILMFVAFVLGFVPVGFYLLGTPSVFALIGLAHLLYLLSGALMLNAKRKQKAAVA